MKNNSSMYKIWELLKPFVIYYFLYNVVFVLIISLCQVSVQGLGNEYQEYLAEHAETVTGLVSGLSMVISVLPLIPMLRGELIEHKQSVAYKDILTVKSENNTESRRRDITIKSITLTITLAASAALGLNILLSLTDLVGTSASYQDVAKQQYSVVFGAGMILFGLISPVTEEIVFRGLIFNRMRRYFPHAVAVIVSGVLFGIYHGNLVQGVYGGCMGIIMAYLYERMHSFLIPCLFHATANLIVYVTAQNPALHGQIFNIAGCALLFGVSVVCIGIVEFTCINYKSDLI